MFHERISKMNQKLKNFFKGASDIISKFLDGDFRGLAAEISFYLLSSFFPMLILIFTVVSSISLNYTDVMFRVISALPHQISDLILDMLTSPSRSTVVIVITGIFTLITFTGMINTVEKALNRFYGLINHRSYLTSKLIALCFSVSIFLSIIASFGLVIFGRVIGLQIHRITSDEGLLSLWNTSRYVLILVFIAMVVSALFKAMPNKKIPLPSVFPGAIVTTVAWYASSMLFALYVNNFPQYEIIYGSLAGFVCLIIWIYLIGISLVAGAKINGMLYQHKHRVPEKEEKRENTMQYR